MEDFSEVTDIIISMEVVVLKEGLVQLLNRLTRSEDLGCGTIGADSNVTAIKAGHPVELSAITSCKNAWCSIGLFREH